MKPADAPFLRGGDYLGPGQFDFIMTQELYFCNTQIKNQEKPGQKWPGLFLVSLGLELGLEAADGLDGNSVRHVIGCCHPADEPQNDAERLEG